MQFIRNEEYIQVRKSETQEWHSNIQMENGGPFECIRMFIPRTCGVLYIVPYTIPWIPGIPFGIPFWDTMGYSSEQ